MKSDEIRDSVYLSVNAMLNHECVGGSIESIRAVCNFDTDLKAHEAQLLEDHHCLTQEQAEKLVEHLRWLESLVGTETAEGARPGWLTDWADGVEKGGTE